MLFYLHEFRDVFPPLNVLRYVSFRIVVAVITSLVMSWLMYPPFIRRLQQMQNFQPANTRGPESHMKKQGTPTMGGSLILLCVVLSTLLWVDLTNRYVWYVLIVTVGYALVGFIDDYKKVSKKDIAGLSGRWKLILQFGVAGVVAFMLFNDSSVSHSTSLYLPFVADDRFSLDLPLALYVAVALIAIVGTSNTVNLTDGLDGLAIGPIIVAAGAFLILCYSGGTTLTIPAEVGGETTYVNLVIADYLKIPHVEGLSELAIFCGAIIGAGIGFLWFNAYPATVFMGDVGSLSLGGALGTLAVVSKNELVSIIIFGVFVVEGLSVILQTLGFKLTRRLYGRGNERRLFLMAPIHHHFEKKGWAEPKIIVRFWIISILLALVALASLKLR